jgi:hypothetical protein
MSRINEFKTRCRDLMGRFDRRVGMDTNQKVDRNCRCYDEMCHWQSIHEHHRHRHATRLQDNQG